MHISGLRWTNPTLDKATCSSNKRIFCIHGTLDNAASFALMGPKLAAEGFDVVALDLPGHGRSDRMTAYSTESFVVVCVQVLDALGWQKCFLCGHSLGQALATCIAGTLPQRFHGTILLEGFGWWAIDVQPLRPGSFAGRQSRQQEAAQAGGEHIYLAEPSILARVISAHAEYVTQREPKAYTSVDAAVRARVQAASNAPNYQFIQYASAEKLVKRSVASSGSLFYFTHDNRIKAVTERIMEEARVMQLIENLPPSLIILGEEKHSYPGTCQRAERRFQALPAHKRKHIRIEKFQGQSHHLHLDSPDLLLPTILTFLDSLGDANLKSRVPLARM
eukprot:TRINITY_DN58211_c0_g1_i1.p1 TRINITY_DN58211_c0_g1~~TRINITY_DN58211_c0_g1_i1.p1  ORF type:complete len:367 (+),score=41.89 TRINITY_DN58211_c0_g1_i1:102-1103(+)